MRRAYRLPRGLQKRVGERRTWFNELIAAGGPDDLTDLGQDWATEPPKRALAGYVLSGCIEWGEAMKPQGLFARDRIKGALGALFRGKIQSLAIRGESRSAGADVLLMLGGREGNRRATLEVSRKGDGANLLTATWISDESGVAFRVTDQPKSGEVMFGATESMPVDGYLTWVATSLQPSYTVNGVEVEHTMPDIPALTPAGQRVVL